MSKKRLLMKNLLFLLLLLMGGVMASCHRHQANTGDLQTAQATTDLTAHLFDDNSKPACHVLIDLAYIAESNDVRMKDSLNRILVQQAFGESYSQLPPEAAMEKYTSDYVNKYRKDLEPVFEEDEQENEGFMESWYSYEKSVESFVERYEKNLLTYAVKKEDYTGGPHGIHQIFYTNIDLRTMKVIKLKDLLKPNYELSENELMTKLYGQLQKDYASLADSDEKMYELGFTYNESGDIPLTENFAIRKEGIEFTYNVYEIAVYALGTISITLPYEEIKPWLDLTNPIIKEQL